uniref:Fam-b protein n=1 Tax=Strongyloides papillosus TaxID=174720 RepID=A0A0N5BGD7_STREA
MSIITHKNILIFISAINILNVICLHTEDNEKYNEIYDRDKITYFDNLKLTPRTTSTPTPSNILKNIINIVNDEDKSFDEIIDDLTAISDISEDANVEKNLLILKKQIKEYYEEYKYKIDRIIRKIQSIKSKSLENNLYNHNVVKWEPKDDGNDIEIEHVDQKNEGDSKDYMSEVFAENLFKNIIF